VIVDSERLHWAAFNAVISEPVSWEDYIRTLIGFDDRDAFRYLFPTLGKDALAELIVKKAAAFQELLVDGGAAALPGAVELIQHLSGNIPIAICSGALREDILPIIARLQRCAQHCGQGKPNLTDAFDTIVTAEDTPVSKPDPAPYRLAKERLGVQSALAIEDTPAGIASAKGAGLKVLAVTNSYDRTCLAEADAVIESLEGLTLEKLNGLMP
jgi:beta-phosphoglucomutase